MNRHESHPFFERSNSTIKHQKQLLQLNRKQKKFWKPSQIKLINSGVSLGDIPNFFILKINVVSFLIPYKIYNYMNIFTYKLVLIALLIAINNSTPVVVNGGEVTLNGVVTDTQIDITVNYTANVQWLAIIFSKDQVNTDLHLLIRDPADTSRPVKVRDCYLNQNSYIVLDNVNHIMPSITNFWGDISYGMKISYSRDLNTNDLQDKRFYSQSVIQVCFMSSLQAFVGGGFQTGNQKICSFFSLHTKVGFFQDRLLGNYAATSLFGGANLTIYATQSTDQGTFQSWLFLGIVHKQQGLTPFSGRWIGVTYQDSLVNTDLAVIQYGYRNFLFTVNIMDMYITNNLFVDQDLNYVQLQGGSDVYQSLGGALEGSYTVALYKRKFRTGDNNRDRNVSNGQNNFCFILGNAWAYTNFSYADRICLTLNLATSYYSNFRVSSSSNSQQSIINYVQPPNTVVVVKWQKITSGILSILFLIVLTV